MSTGYERLVPDYSKYKDRLFVGSHSEHAGPGSEGLARGIGVPHQRAILPPNGDVRTTVRDAVDCLWKYQQSLFDLRQTMRRTIPIARRKSIALVAHDNRKEELLEWAEDNLELLRGHSLYATGTTDQLLKCRLGLNFDASRMWAFGR